MKLVSGFLVVAIITLVIGSVGLWGVSKLSGNVNEIGAVRLPGVQSLLTVSGALESIRVAQRSLLNPVADGKERARQLQNVANAREKYKKAFETYEALPRSDEETKAWKEFVNAVEAWKQENNQFFSLVAELDKLDVTNPQEARGMMEGCLGDHYRLICRIFQAVRNKKVFEGGEDNTQCRFGKWMASYKTNNPAITQAIREAEESHHNFHKALTKVKEAIRGNDTEKAMQIYEAEMIPDSEASFTRMEAIKAEVDKALNTYNRMNQQAMSGCREKQAAALKLLDQIVKNGQDAAVEARGTGTRNAALARVVSIIGMVTGTVAALILGIFLSLSITRPINRIIGELSSGAEQVSAAAGQVSSASQSSAQGASEQASSLEETSAALEEMSSMSKTNAENAEKANSLMGQTTQVVGQAQTGMQQTSDAMTKINEASAKIAKIIKVIEEIAFQTNLLALNAAVEAARAGDHGKGFAVVADEVRNLAQRSAQAANETAQLISDTIDRVKKGTELNVELEKSFVKVNDSANQVAGLVEQITSASKDQAKGVDQINSAMTQMDKVVQQSAAGAEESAAASEELASQSQVLQQTVNQLSALVGGHQGGTTVLHTNHKKASQSTRRTHAQEDSTTHANSTKSESQLQEF